jgi:hypothetical protein
MRKIAAFCTMLMATAVMTASAQEAKKKLLKVLLRLQKQYC